MSQHYFQTTLGDGRRVEVFSGWDRPLSGFFLDIEDLDASEDDDCPYLFSSLDTSTPHPKTYDSFKNALDRLGITVPKEMIEEIIKDGESNNGNKVVIHEIFEGSYVRTLKYEE